MSVSPPSPPLFFSPSPPPFKFRTVIHHSSFPPPPFKFPSAILALVLLLDVHKALCIFSWFSEKSLFARRGVDLLSMSDEKNGEGKRGRFDREAISSATE